jgi:CRISPR-associated protein Cmr2
VESFNEAFPNAEAIRGLARAIPENDRPGYDQDHAGRWQYQVELVQRSLAAQRSIRHVPPNSPVNAGERFPQKCTLLGSFEQMGPDDLRQSRDFWDQVAAQNGLSVDGVRIRQGEALCAVALVKRFAGPAFLREQLQLSANDLRFPDTWTIAAAEWLANAEEHGHRLGPAHTSSWNGHWLHWAKRDQDLTDADACPADVFTQIQDARKPDKCGKPPVYYAILKLDGDDLGGWLRGEKSPKVREVMHPTLVSYYESLGAEAKAGLDARRPVGPALHAAISTALANFALHAVPEIVRKHHGTTIYSGGDDTLVLLPVSQALPCALELRQAFTSDFYTRQGMGASI